jgi:carbon-monoxide dehydrogenase small subunit
MTDIRVTARINGEEYSRVVEPRMLLSDFLRHETGLFGTHVGCEHGVCGACTVLLDGEPVRSCLMFAPQIDGHDVTTVEGLTPLADDTARTPGSAAGPVELHPIQRAFRETHALQCGFCTPGILMTTAAFLAETPDPSRQEIREAISGHLCRCTGYHNIVEGVARAAELLAEGRCDEGDSS